MSKSLKIPSPNLSLLAENHRLGLWILLLLLTALILLFPVQLRYEYHYRAIESIYVFGDNLALFAVLFYVWLAILLLLLFSRSRNSEWQRVALVCLFALVFFGFWAVNTPTGGHWDELWNMGHIRYLQETGKIAPTHPNLSYFQFPAFHLLAFSISEICGLGIFATRTAFLLFSHVLFAALLYLLFAKLLKSSFLSSLAVLLLVEGGLVQSLPFWPGNLASLLLIPLLMLLVWREDRVLGMGTSMTFIMIIVLAAFTISYIPAAASFIFILMGIYLLQKVVKRSVGNLSTIALSATIFLAWQIYVAIGFFGGLAIYIPVFIEGLMNPIERFSFAASVAAEPLGEGVPLWARSIKYFWLAVTIGFGAILGMWFLIKARNLNSREVLESGGLLGMAVFSAIVFLAQYQTLYAAYLLRYLPLFTIPILVRFLSRFSRHDELSCQDTLVEYPGETFNSNGFHRSLANLGGWFRRHIFTLLIILLLVLSFPTFLVHQEVVCTIAIYPYEYSAGEFIESAYSDEELSIFSDVYTGTAYTYHAPEAHFHRMFVAPTKETLLRDMNNFVNTFQNSRDRNAVFVLSQRASQLSHQPAVVEPPDPRWLEIINRLAQNDKIYDNGHTEIFKHRAK
jgi:hypothetical protein